MKNKWNHIIKQLEKTDSALREFLECGGLTAISSVKIKPFIREYNAYKKQIADFDSYISPVDPLEIKFPFTSEALTEMWQRWKDYLSEQHGQIMRTRSEKSSLEHLKELSNGDEEKAVKFLRYAMANRYKNFFAIEEKDTKQPAKGDAGSGSAFD